MDGIVVQGTIVLFLWIGGWGIIEIMIDDIANENRKVRLALYSIILFLGIFMYWIVISIV